MEVEKDIKNGTDRVLWHPAKDTIQRQQYQRGGNANQRVRCREHALSELSVVSHSYWWCNLFTSLSTTQEVNDGYQHDHTYTDARDKILCRMSKLF